jgi:hypothetical protein
LEPTVEGYDILLLLGCSVAVQLLGLMKPPGRAFDAHDNGMMYHPVDNGCGDDRISEIITQFLKIYV